MTITLKKVTIKKHEITWPKSPIIIEKGSLGKIYKVQYNGTDVVIRSSKVKKKKKK